MINQVLSAQSSVLSRFAAWFIIFQFSVFSSQFSILSAAEKPKTLLLGEVLASVQSQYPPYLAALIEQDIANGRVRQAQGAFDLNLNAGGSMNLAGYYDGRTG